MLSSTFAGDPQIPHAPLNGRARLKLLLSHSARQANQRRVVDDMGGDDGSSIAGGNAAVDDLVVGAAQGETIGSHWALNSGVTVDQATHHHVGSELTQAVAAPAQQARTGRGDDGGFERVCNALAAVGAAHAPPTDPHIEANVVGHHRAL